MFGSSLLPPFLHDPFFEFDASHAPVRQAPSNRPSAVIEEVDDHHDHPHLYSSTGEPIVEEPDDDEDESGERLRQRRRHNGPAATTLRRSASSSGLHQRQLAQPTSRHFPETDFGGFGLGFPSTGLFGRSLARSLLDALPDLSALPTTGGASFAFSSYTSSGPDGVTYQATHTSRTGPNGVREAQSTVKDGRTGNSKMRLMRGLGEKERTQTRTRNAAGEEQRREELKGLTEADVPRFEDEWQAAAATGLPRWGDTTPGALRGGSLRLDAVHDRPARPTAAPALTSSASATYRPKATPPAPATPAGGYSDTWKARDARGATGTPARSTAGGRDYGRLTPRHGLGDTARYNNHSYHY